MRSSHTKRGAGSLESMSTGEPSPVVEEVLRFEAFRSDRAARVAPLFAGATAPRAKR